MRRWRSGSLLASRERRVGIGLSSGGLEDVDNAARLVELGGHKLKAAKNVTTFSYKGRRYSRSYPAP